MTSSAPPDDANLIAPPGRSRRLGPLFIVILIVAILLTGTMAVVAIRNRSEQRQFAALRVSGLPASVSTSLANLMSLSPVPDRRAPNFTLTDQKGRTLSLESFKGRTVVLEFMDPHCVDICPLVAQELNFANHDLGVNASKVVFIAVNVNQFFAKTSSMETFSLAHQLTSIASWHFFTGSITDLRKVWRNYGVAVQTRTSQSDVIHTSVMYFIDPRGRERYIATPLIDHTSSGAPYLSTDSLTSWGRGIALVAQSLSS